MTTTISHLRMEKIGQKRNKAYLNHHHHLSYEIAFMTVQKYIGMGLEFLDTGKR